MLISYSNLLAPYFHQIAYCAYPFGRYGAFPV